MRPLQLGVLVSGSGSNLQAILDAIRKGRLNASVRLVLSNKPKVFALERAERAGVPAAVVRHKDFDSREAFDRALVHALREAGVEWVVLAGFMRLLTPAFLEAFPYRVLNIHPALLPAFPGVDAQQQAIDYGVRISGCTVHFVDAGTDTGPILAQSVVDVRDDDTRDSLAARIIAREHQLFPQALQWIADGRVHVTPPAAAGGRATVRVEGVRACVGVAGAR
ncbi:MAG: phosphoribosylglycinamide formyltransferase [Deltaproteobacteria bacterium HGW-Deltaproteobacteria-20]|jgi:phosphoribosylglycinamide formyltransferase-1|nr:MAG: phosphoribosylglycinamide formyltransferase [Deltaproteobacteria bacterium HGW-Deltaproteobacteria-20]